MVARRLWTWDLWRFGFPIRTTGYTSGAAANQ
jgi:hypothetical protein